LFSALQARNLCEIHMGINIELLKILVDKNATLISAVF
jgi:hypothetical protein